MIPELAQLTLTEAVAKLKLGELSTKDLIQANIAAAKVNAAADETKPINAILYTNEAAALQQAQQLDVAARQASLLAGAPIAIKRNINLQGFPVDCCSKVLAGYEAPYTATALENFQRHGGVIFANLNMDEFAMGSANENSIYGKVHNPINRAYIPGGSSGGPAAAVACGEAFAALGTDTGGSVRQPAACCGVVGMKPTYGRVSRYGVVAHASSFDQLGPLTRTVADNALLLQSIAGHDPRDSTSVNIPVADYSATLNASLKGKVIGIPKEYYTADVHPQIQAALAEVKQFYVDAGASLQELSLPTTGCGLSIYYILATAEASTNLARFDGIRYGRRSPNAKDMHELFLKTRSEGFGPEVRRRMFMGAYVLSAGYFDAYYMKALRVRRRLYNEYHAALQTCDFLLTPTMPYRVFKLGERHENPVQMYLSDVYTIAANLTGLPAISVPCAKDEAGLPISFQLMGRRFQEALLYNASHLYEQARRVKFLI